MTVPALRPVPVRPPPVGRRGLWALLGAAPARAKAVAKTALITGASAGIGKATARQLARSGRYSRIVLAGHDEEKTRKAMQELETEVQLEYLPMELASLSSVRAAAEGFQAPLHTLICNAAVMALPERQVTADGYEMQFEVNYLSHFLLVNLLLPQLIRAGSPEDPSRSSLPSWVEIDPPENLWRSGT